jgi:hypothetical protein
MKPTRDSTTRRNNNNRRRGKEYERRAATVVDGVRNLDKGRPHTDVENSTHVYEIKSTQTAVPVWLAKASGQLELAAKESKKGKGGVIKIFTGGAGGRAKAFLITEIEDF